MEDVVVVTFTGLLPPGISEIVGKPPRLNFILTVAVWLIGSSLSAKTRVIIWDLEPTSETTDLLRDVAGQFGDQNPAAFGPHDSAFVRRGAAVSLPSLQGAIRAAMGYDDVIIVLVGHGSNIGIGTSNSRALEWSEIIKILYETPSSARVAVAVHSCHSGCVIETLNDMILMDGFDVTPVPNLKILTSTGSTIDLDPLYFFRGLIHALKFAKPGQNSVDALAYVFPLISLWKGFKLSEESSPGVAWPTPAPDAASVPFGDKLAIFHLFLAQEVTSGAEFIETRFFRDHLSEALQVEPRGYGARDLSAIVWVAVSDGHRIPSDWLDKVVTRATLSNHDSSYNIVIFNLARHYPGHPGVRAAVNAITNEFLRESALNELGSPRAACQQIATLVSQ